MISRKASGAQPRNAIDFERAAMTGTSPRKARNDGTSSLGDLLAHGALEHCAAKRPTVRTGLPAGGNGIRTLGPRLRKGESLSRCRPHGGDKRRSRNVSPPLPGALAITARAPIMAPCGGRRRLLSV